MTLRLLFRFLAPALALLGATAARAQFSAQSLASTPPTSAASPALLNAGQSYPNALTFTITFGQLGVSITSIEIRGTIPPGLSTGGTQVGDANVVSSRPTVTFFGTPTTPGDYRLSVNAITSTGLNSVSQVSPWEVFFRVVATGTAPAISAHPQAQTVTAGANVTFSVVATGTPAPAYQWRKDGAALAGATGASSTSPSSPTSPPPTGSSPLASSSAVPAPAAPNRSSSAPPARPWCNSASPIPSAIHGSKCSRARHPSP